jgi:2C-methyl-D-erythritol 2,4-cyclodiphosphate synthase
MTRFRVGNGFDAHRLVSGRALRLGGVHVKVKSTDGLGALGRSEGIAAQATALLRSID